MKDPQSSWSKWERMCCMCQSGSADSLSTVLQRNQHPADITPTGCETWGVTESLQRPKPTLPVRGLQRLFIPNDRVHEVRDNVHEILEGVSAFLHYLKCSLHCTALFIWPAAVSSSATAATLDIMLRLLLLQFFFLTSFWSISFKFFHEDPFPVSLQQTAWQTIIVLCQTAGVFWASGKQASSFATKLLIYLLVHSYHHSQHNVHTSPHLCWPWRCITVDVRTTYAATYTLSLTSSNVASQLRVCFHSARQQPNPFIISPLNFCTSINMLFQDTAVILKRSSFQCTLQLRAFCFLYKYLWLFFPRKQLQTISEIKNKKKALKGKHSRKLFTTHSSNSSQFSH